MTPGANPVPEPPEELRSVKEREFLEWMEQEATAHGYSVNYENWWQSCAEVAERHSYGRSFSEQERAMWREMLRVLLTYESHTPEEAQEAATRVTLLSRLEPILSWVAGFWPEGDSVREEIEGMAARCEVIEDEVARGAGFHDAWDLEDFFSLQLREGYEH